MPQFARSAKARLNSLRNSTKDCLRNYIKTSVSIWFTSPGKLNLGPNQVFTGIHFEIEQLSTFSSLPFAWASSFQQSADFDAERPLAGERRR